MNYSSPMITRQLLRRPLSSHEGCSHIRRNPVHDRVRAGPQARLDWEGCSVRVSLRSVNHRFLDLRVRTPDGLEVFEPRIRQLVRDSLRRGHVEAMLHVEASQGVSIRVNHQAAKAYLEAAEALRRDFRLVQEPDVACLFRLPGVVTGNGAFTALDAEEELAKLDKPITACTQEALRRLQEMRQMEGASLADELLRLSRMVTQKTAQADALAERSRPAYAKRLLARLSELLGEAAVDPARVAHEAALLVERADVSEELLRLRSHTEQFADVIAGGGEVGKKLDFLLQEMHREINTFLSKTPGLGEDGLAMTDLGLEIKADVEKLREQAQNVE
jgi:uncharacterized protein (TIGR00255 family)